MEKCSGERKTFLLAVIPRFLFSSGTFWKLTFGGNISEDPAFQRRSHQQLFFLLTKFPLGFTHWEPEQSFPDENFLIYHLSRVFLLLSLLIAQLLNVFFFFSFCHQCSFHLIYSLMPQPRCGISKLVPMVTNGAQKTGLWWAGNSGKWGMEKRLDCPQKNPNNSGRENIDNLMCAWADGF